MRQYNQEDTNKALWSICATLQGNIAPGVFVKYMLTMLFYKCISDGRFDRITLPEGASFYDLLETCRESANGARLDKALHEIEEANNAKLEGVFQNIHFNSEELGDEAERDELLCLILEGFARPELDFRSGAGEHKRVGDACEYLLKQFASEIGKAGEDIYTPPEVSQLIARLMAPEPGDEIVDPTCGSASLLLKCAEVTRKKGGGKQTCTLFGQESIGSIWSLAKMNLFLHGEDNHRVEHGDTLRNPLLLDENDSLRLFDVVVAHPPFALNHWDYENAEEDIFNRYARGTPPRTRADFAFILHMIETMKPETGRMAVVMPHGVLFRSGPEEKIRTNIVEENLLDAVIGLPAKLFYGTNLSAVILVFRKQKRDDSVLFIDASHECLPGKNQNFLRATDIDTIVKAYTTREDVEKYARLATLEEIRNYEYNLNIPRYVENFDLEAKTDLRALLQEKSKLNNELVELDLRLKSYFDDFGIPLK